MRSHSPLRTPTTRSIAAQSCTTQPRALQTIWRCLSFVTGLLAVAAVLLGIGALFVLGPWPAVAEAAESPDPAGEESPEAPALSPALSASEPSDGPALDAASCAGCHDDQISSLRGGPHSIVPDLDPAHPRATLDCGACHGDAAAHLEDLEATSIFGFGADELPTTKSNACLSCHGGAHPRFFATRHAAAGLDCSSCHNIHGAEPENGAEAGGPPAAKGTNGTRRALLKAPPTGPGTLWDFPGDSASASCAECHGEVLAQFETNERHRLREGILDCASCHNPHEPFSRLALGGFKQQACTSCHADKEGPFVFEHGSQRVEGCVACHAPHGSPNRHMLTFQSVADLCYSCHANVPGFHTRFTSETVCTNCHSSIHGSNFDAAFLK